MHRFFIETPPKGATHITLSEPESHHAVRVMRLAADDFIEAFDGKGLLIVARIVDASPRRLLCETVTSEITPKEPGHEFTLAIGLIKKADRLEFALEKATEIGVGGIWVFAADHSELSRVREERLLAHLVSAAKQSKRNHVPELRFFRSLDEILKAAAGRPMILAHEKTEADRAASPIPENALLMVGPEGGFSDREVDLAISKGAVAYSLGEFRLRTETAALALLMSARSHLS